ncbi:MAG: PD-(D/E)XK nuclease family protein [Phycisphaerales bacterium]|nr:MAG: PD-(D/E)XK nuclease family protein [Phycisphaerales bacterium]
MAVRFIIGRAGTGKTHHCIEAVRSRLREDAIDGPRLLLLVPEQAGLQMERAILAPADIPGAHRVDVLPFQRLALKVLESAGAPPRQALSEPARAMVLRHLLRDRSRQLHYYRRVDRLGGYIERIAATVAELIQEAVDPEELAEVAEQCTEDNPAQQAKLHDLQLIYRAYLDYLGSNRLDPSQYLQVARNHLDRCGWLEGAELWVDGFASLSGQEKLTLLALARMCGHVDVTVLLDPLLCKPSVAGNAKQVRVAQLFKKTLRTYGDLERSFLEAGITVEEPLVLHSKSPARFSENDGLARLERSLFTPPDSNSEAGGDGLTGVELCELPNRRIEVDYAVSRIYEWVQGCDKSFRYRDIAIIVRDLEPYHDLLSEALTARGIPFFIDRRRPTAHHPLVELIRGAAALAAEGYSLGSVRLLLKTGLLPIALHAADELENYLIAHGLTGIDVWQGEDWSFVSRRAFGEINEDIGERDERRLARINTTRRRFLEAVGVWMKVALQPDGHTGDRWARAIVEWLDALNIAGILQDLADEAEADGDADLAAEHRQVWRDVMSFMEDLAFAFDEPMLTIGELAEVLEQGLAGLTLGLAPPMVDQVLVGSIERSRHPDIRAAVILGFNDGVFPQRASEDAILNDDDRTLLQDHGVRVSPAARDRILDEALLVYVAMTRASDSLVVTYATTDNDGKALRPSPYLEVLRAACGDLLVISVGDPSRLRETWDVLSSHDLAERLTEEYRSRPLIEQDDGGLRSRWNELYDMVRASLHADASLRWALSSLDEKDRAKLSARSVKRLIPTVLHTSVSQLETYATCPFQHFARYALRLREREEADLAPIDVGKVHHAILEDFVRGLSDQSRNFARLSDGELLGSLQQSCARIATRLPAEGVMSDARNAYILRRSASHLARIIRAQRGVSRAGTAWPRAAELPFGFGSPESLPALELTTPAGRRVRLRGYIDRVDLAELGDELLGIVVDYKRTRDKQLSLCDVYHGLSLQLLAYLLVLAENGMTLAGRSIKPAAAFYVSLMPRYHKVDHPKLASSREIEAGGTSRPRGLLVTNAADALDQSSKAGWSDVFSIYRKKDGTLQTERTDAADPGAFGALLEHTRMKLGELADGILDGVVAVNPYRLRTFSPCSWCAMSSVCRFEMGVSDVRFLEELKRSEVFSRLTGESRSPDGD